MITRLFFMNNVNLFLGILQTGPILAFIRSVAQTNLNTGSLKFADFAQCKNGLSKHFRPKQQVGRSCFGGGIIVIILHCGEVGKSVLNL